VRRQSRLVEGTFQTPNGQGRSAGYTQNAAAYRHGRAALDVWIDARGRPVRVRETFTGPSTTGHTTMTTIVSFTGYGRPVSVPSPASSVVTSTQGPPPNPLAAAPGSLLARRLFFQPTTVP
jgi:hypothetical protein